MIEVPVSKLRVRDARIQLGWTQPKLAAASGLSIPTVVNAEKQRPIYALSAQRLLNAMNTERATRGMNALSLYDLDWNIDGE
jgi:transcriptional regulator with XRE-family HTH domain